MEQPTKWKSLKRHPKSAEYPDLPEEVMARMVENLKENGIIGGRKVIIHEQKVFDAWQFYQACIKANIKPRFEPVPRGVDPDVFLETVQDLRRHETQQTAMLRARKRREQVAELREEGKSIRQIAEEVDTSPRQVQRDLAEKPPTVAPATVNGMDGREQPASRPKLLCAGCQTRQRKRQALPGKCKECAALRLAAKKDKGNNQDADQPEEAPKGPPMDDLGAEVPKKLRDAFVGNRQNIVSIIKMLQEARRMLKGLGAWNPFIREHATAEIIAKAIDDIKNGMPYAICPECESKGCAVCRKSGWVTKWKHLDPTP